jgi:hypothetical protein
MANRIVPTNGQLTIQLWCCGSLWTARFGIDVAVRRKDTQIVHLQGYGGRPYHTASVGTDVFDTEVQWQY